MKNLKTKICQWFIDFSEIRMQRTKNIKVEIFWDKIGNWFLRL